MTKTEPNESLRRELNRFASLIAKTQFGQLTLKVTIHNGVPTIVRITEEQSIKLA